MIYDKEGWELLIKPGHSILMNVNKIWLGWYKIYHHFWQRVDDNRMGNLHLLLKWNASEMIWQRTGICKMMFIGKYETLFVAPSDSNVLCASMQQKTKNQLVIGTSLSKQSVDLRPRNKYSALSKFYNIMMCLTCN